MQSLGLITIKEKAELLDCTELLLSIVYPAPPPVDPVFIDPSNLPKADIIKSLSDNEIWQAANRFLKFREHDLADKYYTEFLKRNPDITKVLALKGLTQLMIGKFKEASKLLSKALVQDSSLIEARIWLSYSKLKMKSYKSARDKLMRVINIKNEESKSNIKCYSRAALLIAMTWILEEDEIKAEKYLRMSLSKEPLYITRTLLSCIGFNKGALLFEENEFHKALPIWVEYHALSSLNSDDNTWNAVPEISNYFTSLESLSSYKTQILKNRKKIKRNPEGNTYWLTALVLAGLNLLPEFYEDKNTLEEKELFWKAKTGSGSRYPYARYRHIICLLYQGKFDHAYDELLHLRESIPPSKLSFFRIDELTKWVSNERDSHWKNESASLDSSRENKNIWKKTEFSEEEINNWQTENFMPNEAKIWRDSGVTNAKSASRWKKLGATPEEAAEWQIVFENSNNALLFYASGFRSAKDALNWSRYFSVPAQAWDCYNKGDQVPSTTELAK
ncbi:MAG TPA: hypothetical protein PKA63_06995 [Oligoflexia bacterium]|nr:hypothetical protein [Oligoflexia bacterium]HMP48397.1 hypothetical protein [Oligoflexia bacterium]